MKKKNLAFKEIEKAVQEVLNKAHLNFDEEHIKRVTGEKDNLKCKITRLLEDLAIPGKYRNEMVSNHQLHKGPPLAKIMSVADQITRLKELFPEINISSNVDKYYQKPNNCSDPFVIIDWKTLAPTYDKAVSILLGAMAIVFGDKFKIKCSDFNPENLVQTDRTEDAFAELIEDHGWENTIFLYASLWAGSGTSIRNILERAMSRTFGLDTFSTGLILLTHYKHIRYDYLRINCAGDVYSDNYPKQMSFNLLHGQVLEFEATQLNFYHDSDRVSALGYLPMEFKKEL